MDQRTTKIFDLLQEKVRLAPLQRRLFYLLFGILWASGVLWIVAEWAKDPELGPIRTPLQALTMKVHGAIMLAYLAMLGSFLTHVRMGMALKVNRLSGSSIIAINVILSVTDWMLYYLTDNLLRQWSSAAHWMIGISALLLVLAHIFLGRGWATRLQESKSMRIN